MAVPFDDITDFTLEEIGKWFVDFVSINDKKSMLTS